MRRRQGERREVAPLPLPYRSKKCVLDGWENLIISEADLPQYFNGRPQNIGVSLGDPSGGLVDVDLDAPEAVALASDFLPATSCVFGRAGKRRSHWEYIAGPPVDTKKFIDVGGKMIVEYRSTGCQTVFPGSAHEDTGEPITWDQDGEPAQIAGSQLLDHTARLAAAAVLVRHYPDEGSRQDSALALAGGLLRGGFTQPQAEDFIRAVANCAGDDEVDKRVSAVGFTAAKLMEQKAVTGWPKLAEIIGKPVVDRAYSWLGMAHTAEQYGGAEAELAYLIDFAERDVAKAEDAALDAEIIEKHAEEVAAGAEVARTQAAFFQQQQALRDAEQAYRAAQSWLYAHQLGSQSLRQQKAEARKRLDDLIAKAVAQ